MALSFSVTAMPMKYTAGRRWRVVNITLDNAYVNGTGYTLTPANCGLDTKIESILIGQAAGFHLSAAISGVNAVVKCWKTGSATSAVLLECATNEAGLNTLVVPALVIGN